MNGIRNFTATPVSATEVQLSWSWLFSPEFFNIYHGTKKDTPLVKVGEDWDPGNPLTYIVTVADSTLPNFFKVSSVGADGIEGFFSPVLMTGTAPSCSPISFYNLKANRSGNTTVQLEWVTNPTVGDFRIDWRVVGSSDWGPKGVVSQPGGTIFFFEVPYVDYTIPYEFRVMYTDPYGFEVNVSDTVTAPLFEMLSIEAAAISQSKLKVTATSNCPPANYSIFVATSANGIFSYVDILPSSVNGSTVEFILENLSPERTLWIKVEGMTAYGFYDQSNVVSAKTMTKASIQMTEFARSQGDNNVVLGKVNFNGLTEIRIYESSSSSSPYQTKIYDTTLQFDYGQIPIMWGTFDHPAYFTAVGTNLDGDQVVSGTVSV